MEKTVHIDTMKETDWQEVRQIYIHGIESRNATFDTTPLTKEEWDKKYIKDCRLVVREEEKVIGWAALIPISTKDAFYGVAELSIYIDTSSTGKGIGKKLIQALIEESEKRGFWMLQAGIFPENQASINLHKKFGFRKVGVRERIGKLDGVWRDVVLMERRSKVVGVD
ncbi:GNAT family N-acetyltransferase [Oceanobacillus senegalensis]|uniref:GNAT family N-acetyltransferase n=1 Tax=Oceanobacillus senegalensis TaxID=1936063 RepID=UPI000A30415F|nr:GNAT family N-acetyltransferase [Oceanobacillus senegalensis]